MLNMYLNVTVSLQIKFKFPLMKKNEILIVQTLTILTDDLYNDVKIFFFKLYLSGYRDKCDRHTDRQTHPLLTKFNHKSSFASTVLVC
jgi:hypothetical protein